MAATALIQARIEPELKTEVEKFFAEIGVKTSAGIRMSLKNALKTRSIPYPVSAQAETKALRVEEESCSYEPTPEFAAYLDKEIANIKAGRDLISFENMDDAIAYLDKRKKR